MAMYRKKPVVIEAVQFRGFLSSNGQVNLSDKPEWLKEAFGNEIGFFGDEGKLTIKTLEGEMLVSEGDYIIKGVQGEFYPCKPDIFEQTYEPISGDYKQNPQHMFR